VEPKGKQRNKKYRAQLIREIHSVTTHHYYFYKTTMGKLPMVSLAVAFLYAIRPKAVSSFQQQQTPIHIQPLNTWNTIQNANTSSTIYYNPQRAHRLAATFPARQFHPASPLLDNCHVQTISGALLRRNEACRYITPTGSLWSQRESILQALTTREMSIPGELFYDRRETIPTRDGQDFFHVDYKDPHQHQPSSRGLVVFVHGLQSNSNSTLSTEIATAFHQKGFQVACINFRGCSGVPNNGLKAYHLGFTDDLKHFLTILKERGETQRQPIYLCGKSLGANVVLKALGELGLSAITEYNIQGAAVACVPFDNNRNQKFLQTGFSKLVYNQNLLQSLKAMAFQQLERFGDTEDAPRVNAEKLQLATTITEFDDAYTAPLFGYQDHVDYYNQTSCVHYLPSIRVPTLILNAKDDPFMDPDYYPDEYGCDKDQTSPLKMVRTNGGGHLGYMFHQCNEGDVQDVSFLSAELSRFIRHVSLGLEEHEEGKKDDSLPTAPPKSLFRAPKSLPTPATTTTDDEQFRENAFRIAWAFQPKPCRPSPTLSNCHFQTISGVYLRNDPTCRFVEGNEEGLLFEKSTQLLTRLASEPDVYGNFWDHRQRINTPDGDFFHVDYKYHALGDPSSKGLVIVVHGLQSSSNSSLSVDMGKAFQQKGFDVACINFRGCSGTPNNSLKAYHLGFTDDLKQYLAILNSGFKKPPPIFISGFSLGANVVLKAMGELGMSAYEDFNVYGVAVSGAPFDNERNINFVQKAGFNKLAYNGALLASLKKTALRQLERLSDSEEAKKLDYDKIAQAETISDLENAVIAPLFGFRDNIDYYRQTNCLRFLDDIRVPTIIMNAADDPFFDPDFFPFEKGCHSYEGRQKHSPITLVRTQHGGHLGFMFHKDEKGEIENKDVSFMPQELARFVDHVWERRIAMEQKQEIPVAKPMHSQQWMRSMAFFCLLAVQQSAQQSGELEAIAYPRPVSMASIMRKAKTWRRSAEVNLSAVLKTASARLSSLIEKALAS
jgi:uncharacterized protein